MVILYFRNRLIYDFIISCIFVIIHVIATKSNGNIFVSLSDGDLKTFSLAVFGAAVSLLGFVLAAGTFLISHAQNDASDILRRSASFKDLPKLIASSIWRLAWLSIFTLLLFFTGTSSRYIVLAGVVFLIVFSGSALGALTYIIMKMLGVPLRK